MRTALPDSHASLLATFVRERRLELGLSIAGAARKAGVDRGTWYDIESGTRTNMLPATLNRIDKALDWELGHLRRLARPLEGQEGDYEDQLRRKLIAFAGSLSVTQLQSAVEYISGSVAADERPLTQSDLDAALRSPSIREAIREVVLETVVEHPKAPGSFKPQSSRRTSRRTA